MTFFKSLTGTNVAPELKAALTFIGLSLPLSGVATAEDHAPQAPAITALKSDTSSSPERLASAKPWLGVALRNIDTFSQEARGAIGFQGDKGVLVDFIVPGSPAEESGFQEGDVITHIDSLGDRDGLKAPTLEVFTRLLAAHVPGDTVSMTVVRDGARVVLPAKLGRHPAEGADENSAQLSPEEAQDDVEISSSPNQVAQSTDDKDPARSSPSTPPSKEENPYAPTISVQRNADGSLKLDEEGAAVIKVEFKINDWGFVDQGPEFENDFLGFVTEVATNPNSILRLGEWQRKEENSGSVEYRIEVQGGLLKRIDPATQKPQLVVLDFNRATLVVWCRAGGQRAALLLVTEDSSGFSNPADKTTVEVQRERPEPKDRFEKCEELLDELKALGGIAMDLNERLKAAEDSLQRKLAPR